MTEIVVFVFLTILLIAACFKCGYYNGQNRVWINLKKGLGELSNKDLLEKTMLLHAEVRRRKAEKEATDVVFEEFESKQ